jgi:hypothetical protein
MTQEQLYGAQIGASFQQVRGDPFRKLCGPRRLVRPARSAASWDAFHTVLSEIGFSGPVGSLRVGNRYTRGLIFAVRQYWRNASSTFGVSGS